mgnify:CR=1 FL=1
MKDNAIPISTAVPGGQTSHGTRESSQIKHRLFERLVAEHGASVFAMEANFAGAELIDEYTQTGRGDLNKVLDNLIDGFELPREAVSISLPLDRVSVPMEEPRARPPGRPRKGAAKRPVSRVFRMAYCGTVTLHDARGEALHTIRYGTMPAGDAERLCTALADDVLVLRAKQPELRVALLCDGAPEMWNLLNAEFKDGTTVVRLLDFYHLIEKLAPAARVLFSDEAPRNLARWKLDLLNRSAAHETVLAALVGSGLEDARVGEDRPVHDAITYLRNNAQRMDYATARRQGLPIASGNVEATCKSLVGIRMKRSGARWKTTTGEHVIQLRALALSDRWSAAMDLTLPKTRVLIRRAA